MTTVDLNLTVLIVRYKFYKTILILYILSRALLAVFFNLMCGSRKYPYPHHRGNWKFQSWGGGGGVKYPGNSRGEGDCMIELVSRGIQDVLRFSMDLSVDQAVQKCFLTN